MGFHLASDWKDRVQQVRALKDKCNHIFSELALPEDDARAQGIIHVRQFCNTLAYVPLKLQQNAEVKSNVRIIMAVLGLTQPKDLESCLKDLNRNAKASFITMTQFALENCINRVLDALPGEKAQGTFSESSRRLVKVTNLSEPETKQELLLVPAWLRNSLHSGGVYFQASKTVMVEGESYVFERGRQVSCATWSHLMHCVGSALNVYEEMLCSPIVRAVSKVKII